MGFTPNHHIVGELMCSRSHWYHNEDKDQSHPILPEFTHSGASQKQGIPTLSQVINAKKKKYENMEKLMQSRRRTDNEKQYVLKYVRE